MDMDSQMAIKENLVMPPTSEVYLTVYTGFTSTKSLLRIDFKKSNIWVCYEIDEEIASSIIAHMKIDDGCVDLRESNVVYIKEK